MGLIIRIFMNEHDLTAGSMADPGNATLDSPPAGNAPEKTSGGTPALYLGNERVVRPLYDIVEPAFPLPPGVNHVHISVEPVGALVRVQINKVSSSYWVEWPQNSAAVQKPVLAVRAALENFRQKCSSYLNAVDADDLLEQLSALPPGAAWGYSVDPSAPHMQAWNEPEVQHALHTLAWHGYSLFESLFTNARLRDDVLALQPGDRLEVHWYPERGRQHPFPWGLMYLQPVARATSVDPMKFSGLRLRLETFSYTQDRIKLCLGALCDQTPRAYCLYWDDSPKEISSEAQRQRTTLDRWAGRLFLPTEGVGTPRDELIDAFNRRGPNAHVLYVFCRCHNPENEAVELRFSNGPGDAPVSMPDLNQVDLTNNPLVFINACDTAAGESGATQDLERYYFTRKCGAYIGTEAKVPVQLASRVAEGFFHYFYGATASRTLPAGEALAQIKLLLWKRYRNVGGIFYTLVNEHRLHISAEDHDGADLPNRNGR